MGGLYPLRFICLTKKRGFFREKHKNEGIKFVPR